MIPKRDASFYQLPTELRALYLTGMPKAFLQGPSFVPHFKNERTSKGILRAEAQQKAFDEISSAVLGNQGLVIFCSTPSDQQALSCVATLLRRKHQEGFHKFEFVHPTESMPTSTELTKDLYILTGVHETDASILPHVRRWVRTSLGSEIWLVLTAKEPYRWFKENLGVTPQFLFSLKESVISVG